MEKEQSKNQGEQISQPVKKKRLIVIETDGNSAEIIKADVAGTLELKAIFLGLAESLK